MDRAGAVVGGYLAESFFDRPFDIALVLGGLAVQGCRFSLGCHRLLVNSGHPMAESRLLSVDDAEVEVAHLSCDGPYLLRCRGAVIHFGNRRDLGAGSAEEGLVSQIEFRPVNGTFDHPQIELFTASCMMVRRVMPSRMFSVGGVISAPLRTIMKLAALPSATCPSWLRTMASS